jgi:hypothetical protein
MAKLLRIRSPPSIISGSADPQRQPHTPRTADSSIPRRRTHRRLPASSRTRAPQRQPRNAARRRPALALAPHTCASPAPPQLPRDTAAAATRRSASPQASGCSSSGAAAAGAGRHQAALLRRRVTCTTARWRRQGRAGRRRRRDGYVRLRRLGRGRAVACSTSRIAGSRRCARHRCGR